MHLERGFIDVPLSPGQPIWRNIAEVFAQRSYFMKIDGSNNYLMVDGSGHELNISYRKSNQKNLKLDGAGSHLFIDGHRRKLKV